MDKKLLKEASLIKNRHLSSGAQSGLPRRSNLRLRPASDLQLRRTSSRFVIPPQQTSLSSGINITPSTTGAAIDTTITNSSTVGTIDTSKKPSHTNISNSSTNNNNIINDENNVNVKIVN